MTVSSDPAPPDPAPPDSSHPVTAPAGRVRFAHPSERLFAALLDVSGIRWEYEPVEFALRWEEDGSPSAGFRPDFWLPEHRLLRRADHGRPAPGDPQERQGAPAAPALPRGRAGRRVPAGLPGPAGPPRPATWPTRAPHRLPRWTVRRLRQPDRRRLPRPPVTSGAPRSTTPTGPSGPRWWPSGAGRCRCPTRPGPWPSTGPAGTAAVAFDVSHLGTVRVDGAGRLRPPAGGADQRPAAHRAGPGPVHPPPRRRRLGGRRHHRVVGRRPSASTSCPTPPTPARVRGGHRRPGHHGRPGRHRRPGARGPGPAGARWRRRRPAVPRFAVDRFAWQGDRLRGRRHRLHRRGRGRVRRPGRRGRGVLGGRAGRRGRRRPGWGPATPCASRPACRCTATSWARASRRCRPAWAGSWLGQGCSSGAGPPWRPSGPRVRRRLRGPGGRGPPAAPRRRRRAGRRRGRSASVTSGNFSPDARAGDRPGLPRHRRAGLR